MAGQFTEQFGKLALFAGLLLVVVGVLFLAGSRLGFFGLGRLPGDLAYRGRHFSIYVPIATCILLSAVLTLLLWVISLLRRP